MANAPPPDFGSTAAGILVCGLPKHHRIFKLLAFEALLHKISFITSMKAFKTRLVSFTEGVIVVSMQRSGGLIGYSLADLRETAGLTQSQIADKMKARFSISAAGISRIEAGDRPVTNEEMDAYLDAIDSEEARQFRTFFDQDWIELERPPFDHIDREALWRAETVLKEIRDLYDNPDLKAAFRKHVERYEQQLRQLAQCLLVRDHLIAIVGSIGVGKSTKICRLAGLEITSDRAAPQPVLEVGGGGITICEVHITRGPGFGVIVEPRSHDEIKADVADFCDYMIGLTSGPSEDPNADADALGISKEIVRAIRNMSKLTIKKSRGDDGKTVRQDRAKELAARIGDRKDLLVQVLSQMELHRRDRRDVWYSKESGKAPLEWLRDTFAKINNGRHEDFSLPKRIEVVVPTPLLFDDENDEGEFNVRIVDTKGVDQTAGRADLECHFDDPHTVVVLCSRFNDAPEASTQQLLQRARDAGVQDISDKASLVVLPRPEEAMAMKDDEGIGVDDDNEGYELKQEQLEMRLSHIGVDGLPVRFFNARSDNPRELRKFLIDRIENLRSRHREEMDGLIRTIEGVLENHDKEQYRAVLRNAAQRLAVWLNANRDIADMAGHVQEALLSAMAGTHASTVRASIRREGDWPNLDYRHQLGFGARKIAAACVGDKVDDFVAIADNLISDPELSEAHDFVRQVKQMVRNATDRLLKKIQIAGRSAFSEDLRNAVELWSECESEWGAGSGYRDRVTNHNRDWFADSSHSEQHKFIRTQILNGWTEILAELGEMLETGVEIE